MYGSSPVTGINIMSLLVVVEPVEMMNLDLRDSPFPDLQLARSPLSTPFFVWFWVVCRCGRHVCVSLQQPLKLLCQVVPRIVEPATALSIEHEGIAQAQVD